MVCEVAEAGGLLEWKTGEEPPPFVATNQAAVIFVHAVLTGSVEPSATSFIVSDAVVLQIYELIFSATCSAEMLKDAGWDGFYRIVASLSLRSHAAVDAADIKRLRAAVARKKSASHPKGGLVARFREVLGQKRSDAELHLLDRDAAARLLIIRWDAVRFDFEFAAGGGGGGGGDGGGDGTATSTDPPPLPTCALPP